MNRIRVDISDDYYAAYLTIDPGPEPVDLNDVLQALQDRHVVYGTDLEVIKALVNVQEDVYGELVAEGQPHVHGIDSEIIRTHELSSVHPALRDDGSVDFKNLDYLEKVSKGEILASKIPATEGMDGMTVTGKVIHAKDGKDNQFQFGENIEVSEDGLTAFAACDGVYKVQADKMVVLNYLELKNGVGVETGNIAFKGDIFVQGNVISGYSISCDGNLNIDGLVEDAHIEVTGDLVVSKGIAGHKGTKVYCDGNLVTKFIDNSEVRVKGNMEVDEIVNSKVLCDGEVTVKGKKGHIIGGEITARYAINATTIGSRLGVITLINLGVDIESVRELQELRQLIKIDQEKEKKLKTSIDVLKRKELKGLMTPDEKELFDRCLVGLEQIKYNIKEKMTRIQSLQQLFLKARSGQLKTETIFPDTLVRIGKSSYFIDEAILRSIIKKSHDEIVAIGF